MQGLPVLIMSGLKYILARASHQNKMIHIAKAVQTGVVVGDDLIRFQDGGVSA